MAGFKETAVYVSRFIQCIKGMVKTSVLTLSQFKVVEEVDSSPRNDGSYTAARQRLPPLGASKYWSKL
jgi:hypothetical protein